MFGGIDTEATEADRHEIYEVCCDAVLDVRFFRVEIGQTYEPAFGNDLAVGPGAETSLAVEVGGAVGHRREF